MSKEIEDMLETIPVVNKMARQLKKVKLRWIEGLTLYELLEIYIIGVIDGAISYRAAAISFSFFMSLFPFALFILNLIPYIPIENFQTDFLRFISENVPPRTYDAIAVIINDILNNSNSGLVSSGFILSIFLMANGLNAILGGFETSHHVLIKRGFFRQYFIALGLSLLLSFLLIMTVATIVVFEVFIQSTSIRDVLMESVPIMVIGRYIFMIIMILLTTSILFKYGTKHTGKRSFITAGSIFTTFLIIISSYIFGIWVVQFSQYNELYGSIGTLLIVMFYIWICCMILLLGFELDSAITRIRRKNLFT
ncbi:MAG TPA: YihY/virulence factor BrkB family protein [Flavobacterium sp.]|jgi:membrane protein